MVGAGLDAARGQRLAEQRFGCVGNELWTNQFGATNNTNVDAVTADATGVYVAGSVNGTLPGQTATDPEVAFVRKYDLAGIELWTRQFGTPETIQALGGTGIRSIAVDASGVYVGGATTGVLPGQVRTGIFSTDTDEFGGKSVLCEDMLERKKRAAPVAQSGTAHVRRSEQLNINRAEPVCNCNSFDLCLFRVSPTSS
jgi:hypothetical protein